MERSGAEESTAEQSRVEKELPKAQSRAEWSGDVLCSGFCLSFCAPDLQYKALPQHLRRMSSSVLSGRLCLYSPRGGDIGFNLGEVPKNIPPILGSILGPKGGSKNEPFWGPPLGPPSCPSWPPLASIVAPWGAKWGPKWSQNGVQKRASRKSKNSALV